MKRIYARSCGTVEVRVYRDTEWQEYVTKTYDAGQEVASYHTESKTDAIRHADMVICEERKLAA
jgi:hypothetical protein